MNVKIKFSLFALCLVMLAGAAFSQDKYFTKTGKIDFNASGPLEKIEARHKSVTCVLDTKSGSVQFAILMKGFEFDKALMQQHFNENYVESHKFPKGEFKGEITNNSAVNYIKDGTYPVTVKGNLTIHGETKPVETPGTITIKQGKISTSADFSIQLSDYRIEIPKIVKDNISNTVKISVNCTLEPLKS